MPRKCSPSPHRVGGAGAGVCTQDPSGLSFSQLCSCASFRRTPTGTHQRSNFCGISGRGLRSFSCRSSPGFYRLVESAHWSPLSVWWGPARPLFTKRAPCSRRRFMNLYSSSRLDLPCVRVRASNGIQSLERILPAIKVRPRHQHINVTPHVSAPLANAAVRIQAWDAACAKGSRA